jgi:ribonuclease Z
MHRLNLTILGNGSAAPTSTANPSSQLLTYEGKQFLFDCGEGTQIQLIKFKLRYRRLDHIFISHLHGDHFFGLVGLISTFHLFGRDRDLTIFAPAALESLIRNQLSATNTKLNYNLIFKALEDFNTSLLLDDADFQITTFPLLHSVPTWGFLFKEKLQLRKINKEFVKKKKLRTEQIISIKKGNSFTDNKGVFYSNDEITTPSRAPISYAYCSDTAYNESIVDVIKNVDLLYHEATFDNSMESVAKNKLHSTASQAAKIAKMANAKELLLGHYSGRFKDPSILLTEAKEIFPDTLLSKEGQTYLIESK